MVDTAHSVCTSKCLIVENAFMELPARKKCEICILKKIRINVF